MMNCYHYLYSFKYDTHNDELCKLESRQLFDCQEQHKLLFSTIKVDPSISPFIKSRLEILSSAADYSLLLKAIEDQAIHWEGFKAEYLVLDGDLTEYPERLEKLKDVGDRIEGDPNYQTPTRIYAICRYGANWYFGILKKHDSAWFKHRKKPRSFSSSINMDIAKALVSIASKGQKDKRLLDACCGVGTIMLEACISGMAIDGCDINWKACQDTRANLAHYHYQAKVYRSDISELRNNYDTAIIDLPYNLYSFSNDAISLNILQSAARLAPRLVVVSNSDVQNLIEQSGLNVSDRCKVAKKGKNFSRTIWVCEKNTSHTA